MLRDKLIRSKEFESVGDNLKAALYFTFTELDECFFGAQLCVQEIEKQKKDFLKYLEQVVLENYLDDSRLLTLKNYEYFFFCCSNKFYHCLDGLRSNNFYPEEIANIQVGLKFLKDQRDGFEHGNEDTWMVYVKGKTKKQSDEELLRKGIKGDNFDFPKNMAILENAFSEIEKLLY